MTRCDLAVDVDEGSRPDDKNPVAAIPTDGANCRGGSSAMPTMRGLGLEKGDDGSSGSEMIHDVPRFTSPRWRIATSC